MFWVETRRLAADNRVDELLLIRTAGLKLSLEVIYEEDPASGSIGLFRSFILLFCKEGFKVAINDLRLLDVAPNLLM